ncbi:hypothetical protein BDF22DRAFT_698429 [Syncephalis plumigaleata]|nr:hypothetical protein BDF22DRAFT_698429 [Syncephalis plumigaleata]
MDFSAFHAAHFGASQRAAFQRLVNPGEPAGPASYPSSMATAGCSEAYDRVSLLSTDHAIATGKDAVEGSDVVESNYYVDAVSDQDEQDALERSRLVLAPAVIEMFARSAAYREELRREKEREDDDTYVSSNDGNGHSESEDEGNEDRRSRRASKRLRSRVEPNPLDDMPCVNSMQVYKELYGSERALEIVRRETALNAVYRTQCQQRMQISHGKNSSNSAIVVWPVLPLNC